MKRRQVITAFGTLAIGTGTALGTGAFSATSSSSDAALSIVTQGDNVNLDIRPGNGVEGNGNIENVSSTDDFYDATSPDLSFGDLPRAVVHNPEQGMVNIQLFAQYGVDHTFSDIIEVVNYDPNQDYEVGFAFTGFGAAVVEDSDIPKADVPKIFEFVDESTNVISFNVDPSTGEDLAAADFPTDQTFPTVSSDSPEQIDLSYWGDSQQSLLPSAYNATPGNFTGNTTIPGGDDTTDGKAKQIVDEITAVANEAN